jgi:hypothetical protein
MMQQHRDKWTARKHPTIDGEGNTTCTATIDAGTVLPSATDCSSFITTIHAGTPVNQNFADGAA